jgi:hypothetical protein
MDKLRAHVTDTLGEGASPELIALGVWVVCTVGEGETSSYGEIDRIAWDKGMLPPDVRLTKTPEFARIKAAFLEHHSVH